MDSYFMYINQMSQVHLFIEMNSVVISFIISICIFYLKVKEMTQVKTQTINQLLTRESIENVLVYNFPVRRNTC